MSEAEILARLHVLFGIPEADDTHDDQLKALFATALAAARTYTHRWLYPLSQFRETFQQSPGCCRTGWCEPVLVAEVPVKQFIEGKRDGTDLDAASLVATAPGYVWQQQGLALMPIYFSHLDLTYEAGYEELPADLAEALCQVAAAAGGASVEAAGGTAPEAPVKKLTVFDVGSVEYAGAAGAFYSAEITSQPGGPNALLGPWTTTLDAYRDLSKGQGGGDCIRTLENLGAPVAEASA